MATVSGFRRRWAWVTLLRAALMLIAGIYAVIWPGTALVTLVMIGGALLLIDGVLGLWSLTFGGARTGNYWFDVVRNVFAIIAGGLLLVSFMAALAFAVVLIYIVAVQAIVVGLMEIVVIVRERQSYARIWPVVLSGALYVLFGIALLFAPLMGAVVMTVIAGVLAIVFAVGLFGLAFKLFRQADAPAA